MIDPLGLPALGLPVLAAVSCALHRRGRAAAAARAAMLEPCAALLAEPVHGRDRAGYGTLRGRFAGLPVEVRLIPEALAFRRLPQLWLSVSVHVSTGLPATLDVLRRAVGAEFYAPDELPARYPVPPGWPGETLVRGTRGAGPLLARAAAALAKILAEPRVKEVLVAPRGVRIVSQLCQGERGAYLLLRECRFPIAQVDPGILRPRLAEAAELTARLSTEEVGHDGHDADDGHDTTDRRARAAA
ncbi:hypothetical protein [Methylobacterium nigriterrae]|uniref:hypothetical protein n=1 Tax=Methylobacterium nigriterrae TaxID=3127512 RepID=UPI0030134B44